MNDELRNMNEDWVEVALGELCKFSQGVQVPKGKQFKENNQNRVRFLRIIDFTQGKDEPRYIEKPNEINIVTKNDISMVRYGTVGYVCTGIEGAIASNLFRIIPRIKIDKKYLISFLKSGKFRNQINAKGATMQALSFGLINSIGVPLAPLPIQRAIVSKIESLFSDLDNGIANLKKAQEQLKIYRQAVLKKAFEGELTKEWREKQTNLLTAEELLQQIKEERQNHYNQQIEEWKKAVKEWEKNGKEGKKPSKPQKHKEIHRLTENEISDLPKLPTKWKWVRNNELMYYITSGSRDWKKYYSDIKGTYFVRTQDINTNKLNLEKTAYVDLPKDVEGKRSLIEKGDLLMTITGANVGKVAHVDFEIEEAYVSQSVALLKYVLKDFSPYLHYYFQSSGSGAKFIRNLVYGMGRPVLSLDNMREAPVSVCSLPEQHQIVQEIETRLSVCDKVEQSITESLEKAKALRQSILKKAFEGKLLSEAEIEACKQEADYEPASVLLEKIKAEKLAKEQEAKKTKKKGRK